MLVLGLAVLVTASTPCDSLKTLSTPQTTIAGAEVVPAGRPHRPSRFLGTAA